MAKPAHIREQRRKDRSSIGEIKLSACRAQEQPDAEGYIVILEGDPVLLGTFPPNVSVGGQSPTVLRAERDGRVAVGRIAGKPEGREATIDYGFTKASCAITKGTEDDKRVFREVMTLVRPRRTLGDRLRRCLRALFRKG